MKKFAFATVIGTALLFSACSKTPEPEQPKSGNCIIDGREAPKWVCGNYQNDDSYYDVGVAEKSKAGFGFTRKIALADARSNLAQQIETLVKDKVETFVRSTGTGDNETVDKVATAVSKQVAKVALNGSKQVAMWQTDNSLFVLVKIDKKNIAKEVVNKVKTSFKNDEALWQQFQAKQSLESLEKEFE